MNVTLYSTGCPKCTILKKKLDDANIKYNIVTDVDVMQEKGFMTLPMLEVDDEVIDFGKAVKWVNGERGV